MGKRIVDGENVGIALCCFDKRSYHIDTDTIHGRDSLRMYIVCALQRRMSFANETFMARSDPITEVLRHGLPDETLFDSSVRFVSAAMPNRRFVSMEQA